MYKKLDSGDVTLRLNALLIYSDREELSKQKGGLGDTTVVIISWHAGD